MSLQKIGKYIEEYTKKNKNNDPYPVYSVTNSNGFCTDYFYKDVSGTNKTTYKIVPKGYFAYNPSRINVGSIDWQNREDNVIVSPLYVIFRCLSGLDQDYLKYFLKSSEGLRLINEKTCGSVRNNLKFKDLSKFEFNIVDVEDQRKIVSKLKLIESAIQNEKKQIELYDELIKARFVEMFGNEKNSKNYPVIKVQDVADVNVGVVIKPSQYYTDSEHGVKAFRSLNIGEMYVKNEDWVYFSEEGQRKNTKSILRKDDLVIVRSGAPGTACVITEEYEGSNAVDVIIAHPDKDKVNPYYLCAFTNFPHGKSQIKEGTGGAAQQHFNVGKYKDMDLIYPPKKEQDLFVEFVRQIDKSKVVAKKRLSLYEELLKKKTFDYYIG